MTDRDWIPDDRVAALRGATPSGWVEVALARSWERLNLLGEALDGELGDFYTDARLADLARAEAEIVRALPHEARIH